MPRQKKVTLRSLAGELGLTVQTVSKALHGKPGMSEETRQIVLRKALSAGYRTMEQLRVMSAENIHPYPLTLKRFLLVYSDETYNYNRLLLEGLCNRFEEFGHQVEPVLLREAEVEDQASFTMWCEENHLAYCDGMFIAPRIGSSVLENRLLQLSIPKVLFGYPHPGAELDSVVWDVYQAIYISVLELVNRGHTRVMYVGDSVSMRGYSLRWQAFQDAMGSCGLEVQPNRHSISCRQQDPGWFLSLKQLLKNERPTAVLCGIDEEAPAVMDLLSQYDECTGMFILNDRSFDSISYPGPYLPIRETGYRGADRMLWRIANPAMPWEHIRLSCTFEGYLRRKN